MKRLSNLHMTALALAFTVMAGTPTFAADRAGDLSGILGEGKSLLSSSDFKALSGVSADYMSEAELDQVQGKFQPCVSKDCFIPSITWDNPLCWVDGCGGPGPLFDLRRQADSRTQILRINGGMVPFIPFNPQPEPPAIKLLKVFF